MSYRNPQIFFADSTALQKGFEAGFSSMQGKFEKERLEKERIAKEQEDALKEAYNNSDLSDVANLDTRIMAGLQSSIDSIIEKGKFATASASEQAKMLRQVSAVKNTIQRLGDLAAMPQENWDIRNSAKISTLKTALTKGDKSINIVGDGLDLKIVGDFGEVTLDELSAAKFMDKTGFDDEYQDLTTKFIKNAEARYAVAASQGVELDKQDFKTMFFNIVKKEGDPELWSYLYSNQMDSKKMEGRFYGDPETKKVVGEDYEDRQFNTMIDDLFENVIGSAYDSKALLKIGIEDREMARRKLQVSEQNAAKTSVTEDASVAHHSKISSAIETINSMGWLQNLTEMARKGEDFTQNPDSTLGLNLVRAGFSIEDARRDENTNEITAYTIKFSIPGKSVLHGGRGADTFTITMGRPDQELKDAFLSRLGMEKKSIEDTYPDRFNINSTSGGVTVNNNIYS